MSSVDAMFVVRAASPQDADALVPLCAAHAAYERLPYSETGHAQRLQAALANGQLHAWLLEQGGLVLGYASVTIDFATLSGARFAHLDCLYLEPNARGQGGGIALMRKVQSFAFDQGCTAMQWQTPDWNHNAMRFYVRLGAAAKAKWRYTLNIGVEES